MRYSNKQESMFRRERKKQSTETVSESPDIRFTGEEF